MVAVMTVEGLTGVIADLTRAESKAYDEVRASGKRSATNLKDALNANLAGSRHFKGASGSVSYDEATTLGTIGFEVGPDKQRRGGALGNIAFFGTSKGGGTVDLDGPIRAEAEVFGADLNRRIGGLL